MTRKRWERIPACCVFVERAVGREVAAAQLAVPALLAFIKASMAKRYHICYIEPLLACILTCMHAALARVSKIKGHI